MDSLAAKSGLVDKYSGATVNFLLVWEEKAVYEWLSNFFFSELN